MLRATNVPMIDEHYVERVGDYEWKFAGLPEDGQLGSFYTMHTLVSDLNEYIYRVVVSDVPKRVCRQVLSLNPTDIDAIYVEGDEPTDEECPNELNTMAFYFDEYGTGGHLPDIDNPNPEELGSDTPVPPLPEPGEDCLEKGTYFYGDNCEYTGECCLNPLAEGCPPSCTPKGCPEAPTCGACEQYVNNIRMMGMDVRTGVSRRHVRRVVQREKRQRVMMNVDAWRDAFKNVQLCRYVGSVKYRTMRAAVVKQIQIHAVDWKGRR